MPRWWWAVIIVILIVIGGLSAIFWNRNPQEAMWQKRIDAALAPADCPTPLAQSPRGDVYNGPLIDTHVHIPSIPDSSSPVSGEDLHLGAGTALGVNLKVSDLACTLKLEGTKKAVVFFPVYKGMESQHLAVVRGAMKNHPDSFIPFIMPPDNDNSPDGSPTVDAVTLSQMLVAADGLFAGYGEIGLYERDGGAKALPPDASRLSDIYPVVRQHNLTVYLHPGFNQRDNLRRALAANPDINFIFHGGHLIGFNQDKGERLLGDLDEILANHPNAAYGVDELYGGEWLIHPDVSFEKFANHFQNRDQLLEKDVSVWKAFIERHPDQVVWGTDRSAQVRWSYTPEAGRILTDYVRAFIHRLDPAVQAKFAYQNAERIFDLN